MSKDSKTKDPRAEISTIYLCLDSLNGSASALNALFEKMANTSYQLHLLVNDPGYKAPQADETGPFNASKPYELTNTQEQKIQALGLDKSLFRSITPIQADNRPTRSITVAPTDEMASKSEIKIVSTNMEQIVDSLAEHYAQERKIVAAYFNKTSPGGCLIAPIGLASRTVGTCINLARRIGGHSAPAP